MFDLERSIYFLTFKFNPCHPQTHLVQNHGDSILSTVRHVFERKGVYSADAEILNHTIFSPSYHGAEVQVPLWGEGRIEWFLNTLSRSKSQKLAGSLSAEGTWLSRLGGGKLWTSPEPGPTDWLLNLYISIPEKYWILYQQKPGGMKSYSSFICSLSKHSLSSHYVTGMVLDVGDRFTCSSIQSSPLPLLGHEANDLAWWVKAQD